MKIKISNQYFAFFASFAPPRELFSRDVLKVDFLGQFFPLYCFFPIFHAIFEATEQHMTITQTVEIPADRRITLEIPREIPTGRVNLEYRITPFVKKKTKRRMTEEEEIEFFNKNADRLNAEALDVLSYQDDLW